MKVRMKPYILLLALALTSCDTFYGINRVAELTIVPDLERISAAIRSVEGISRVTYKRYDGSSPSDIFFYSGTNGICGRVSLETNKTGKKTFGVHFISSNRIPPQGEIDRNYATMLKVEEQIEKQCGLDGLSKSVTETSSPKMKHRNAQHTSAGDSSTRNAGLGTPDK